MFYKAEMFNQDISGWNVSILKTRDICLKMQFRLIKIININGMFVSTKIHEKEIINMFKNTKNVMN